MISLIKRDILKNTKYKYILYIITIYLLYLIFQKIIFPNNFKDIIKLFSRNLGICYDTNHFLDILIILLTNFFLSYNAISILFTDLKYGKEQILLRISTKKYIITKLISILIITFLINLIIYLILTLSITLMGYNIYNFVLLKIFIMDLIIKILFQYIVIAIYTLFRKNISIFFSFITPLTALLKINSGKIFFAYNNNMYILLLILILITIFTYLILKLKSRQAFLLLQEEYILIEVWLFVPLFL